MSGGRTPGPWVDWVTLQWLIEPQRLLANSADARLIAAAPEMLEALKAARTMLRRAANTAKTVGLGRDLNCQADELDAAIAKVRGAA